MKEGLRRCGVSLGPFYHPQKAATHKKPRERSAEQQTGSTAYTPSSLGRICRGIPALQTHSLRTW